MRKVKFDSGAVPNYDQFGGMDNFGQTEIVGSECIGVYLPSGSLPSGLSLHSGLMPWEKADSKLIDMGRLSELLPDAVILELEDFRSDTNAAAAKRKAASRILLIIASGREWDVYGDDYETLITKLISNTALTGPQATTITDTLKAS